MSASPDHADPHGDRAPRGAAALPLWLKWLLPAATLVVLAAGGWLLAAEKRQLHQSAAKELETVARLKIEEITKWREDELSEGEKLLASPYFGEAVAGWLADPQPAQTEKLLAKLRSLQIAGRYHNILLLDTNGAAQLALDHNSSGGVPDAALKATLRNALATGKVTMTGLRSEPDGKPCLVVLAPIMAPDNLGGRPAGAVALHCDVGHSLYPLVQSWPVPSETEETFLVRRDGDAVLYLNDARFQGVAGMRYRFPLSETNRPEVMAALGRKGLVTGVDYRNDPVIAYLAEVPDSPWFLVAKVSRREALGIWHTEAALILNLLVVSLAALLAIGLVFWQRIQKVHFQKMFESEQARRTAEARFRQIYEQSPMAYQSLDAEGRIGDVNPAWTARFGYPRDEVIGRRLADILTPHGQARFAAGFPGFLSEGSIHGAELEIRCKQGEVRTATLDGVFIRDPEGRPGHAHCLLQDITERKEAEARMQEHERRFRHTLENLQLLALTLDREGYVTFANDQLLKATGWQPGEIVGAPWADTCVPPEDRDSVKQIITAAMQSGDVPAHYENKIISRDGARRLIRWNNTILRDAAGNVTGAAAIGEDITERRQIQEQLRQSELRYRNLVETTADWIWEVDAEGRYTYCSPKVHDLLGYHPEEILGRTPFDLMPEAESKRVRHLFQAFAGKRGPFTALANVNIHKTGRLVVLESSAAPMLDAQGRLTGFRGIDRDITERQQIQEQLRESEERYRTVINLMPMGIVLSIDEKIAFTNPEARRIVAGQSSAELLGKSVFDFVAPAEREALRERRARVLATGETAPLIEVKLLRLDGTSIQVEVFGARVTFRGHNAVLNVIRDITDRLKTESALRERDQLLVQMGRTAKVGGWSMDTATGQGQWTEEVARIHDLDPTQPPDREMGLSFYPGESRAKVEAAVQKCAADGTPYDLELEIVSAKGIRKWIRTIGFPVWENGRVIRVQGSSQDISDLKQAEHEARKEEQFRRKIIDQATEGVCVGHFVSGFPHLRFTVWNDRMTRITGCTLSEINERGWLETLFPDLPARQRAIDRMWLMRQGTDLVGEEWGITCADGRKRTVAISTAQLTPETPGDTRADVLAFFTDVTERKQAEAEISKLSHAVEQSPVSIIITSTAGAIEYVNPTFEKVTGYTGAEVIGKNPRLLKSGKTPADIYRQLWQTITGGGVWHGELCNRRKNGELFWEASAISPIRDAHGVVSNYLAIKEDITQRKHVEEILRQQAELLDAANDAIVVRTLTGEVKFWNTGAERIYGWRRAEALGQKSSDLIQPQGEPARQNQAELFLHGNWVGEIRRRSKDGRELVAFCRLTVLRDEAGNPAEILDISTDITEKKQLEANFLRAQRMEGIGALAGGIAHDLNNILAPILMAMPLLRDYTNDPEARQMIGTIETCARRGADIIRQLLTFARGKPGSHAALPVRSLMAEMDKLLRETFPRNIEISFSAARDLPPVLGDATQIHQALMNLCVNARDAMPNGGKLQLAAIRLTLSEKDLLDAPEARPGDYVCISVADTGAGIPPEHLNRIFDPFFTTKEIGKGTGLGLATVLGIVRGHEGFVRVKSQVDTGTTFELFFPAAHENKLNLAASAPSAVPKGSGQLILVVDDEGSVRNLVQRLLEKNGYRVLVAPEGAAGLMAYQEHHADIQAIITDMMMPGMDGPAMVQEIRKTDPHLPILGMTGLAERAGFKGIEDVALTVLLNKPFSTNDLLSALQSALADAGGTPK